MFSMLKTTTTFLGENTLHTHDQLFDLRVAGMIDVDVTFFIQFFIFVFLIIVLKALVYNPFLDLQDKRHQATGGSIQDAKDAEQTVADLQAKLEQGVSQAQNEGTKIREDLRSDAEKQATQETQKTAAEMAQRVETELTQLKQAEADARSEMNAETARLAGVLADRVLGV